MWCQKNRRNQDHVPHIQELAFCLDGEKLVRKGFIQGGDIIQK